MGAGAHALNKESVFSPLILEPLLGLQKAGLCAGAALFCSALHTRRSWALPRVPAAGAVLSAELLEGTHMCVVEGVLHLCLGSQGSPHGQPPPGCFVGWLSGRRHRGTVSCGCDSQMSCASARLPLLVCSVVSGPRALCWFMLLEPRKNKAGVFCCREQKPFCENVSRTLTV